MNNEKINFELFCSSLYWYSCWHKKSLISFPNKKKTLLKYMTGILQYQYQNVFLSKRVCFIYSKLNYMPHTISAIFRKFCTGCPNLSSFERDLGNYKRQRILVSSTVNFFFLKLKCRYQIFFALLDLKIQGIFENVAF